MKTSKTYISDSIHSTKIGAMTAFAEALAAIKLNQGADDETLWNTIIQDNLPTIESNGEHLATFGPDGNGLPEIDPAAGDLGKLAIVTVWNSDHTVPQPEGLGLQTVSAIYLLQLPNMGEITTSPKLAGILNKLVDKAYLTAARTMARDHAKDPASAPLNRDRIAALISATSTRAGKGPEEAFKILYPVLAAIILQTVEKKCAAMEAAGQAARAKSIRMTFSKARLNADTLKQCLQSADAAKDHFPGMPQEQWVALLKIAIEYAPKHLAKVAVKDDAGEYVKDGEGKRTYTKQAAPQNPLFFQICLETRDKTVLEIATDSISFDDMLTAPADQAAA